MVAPHFRQKVSSSLRGAPHFAHAVARSIFTPHSRQNGPPARSSDPQLAHARPAGRGSSTVAGTGAGAAGDPGGTPGSASPAAWGGGVGPGLGGAVGVLSRDG